MLIKYGTKNQRLLVKLMTSFLVVSVVCYSVSSEGEGNSNSGYTEVYADVSEIGKLSTQQVGVECFGDLTYEEYIREATSANEDGWYFKMFDGPTVSSDNVRKVNLFGIPTSVYGSQAESKWASLEGFPMNKYQYPNSYASVTKEGHIDFTSSEFSAHDQMYKGRYMVALGGGVTLDNWSNNDYFDGKGGRGNEVIKKYGTFFDIIVCDRDNPEKEYYIPCVLADSISYTYLSERDLNTKAGVCHTSIKRTRNGLEKGGLNSKAVVEFCTGSASLGHNNRLKGLSKFRIKGVIEYVGTYE